MPADGTANAKAWRQPITCDEKCQLLLVLPAWSSETLEFVTLRSTFADRGCRNCNSGLDWEKARGAGEGKGGNGPKTGRSFALGPHVSRRADNSGPTAGSFKRSFVSSSLGTVHWFNCKAGSPSDAHVSRLQTLFFCQSCYFGRQQFVGSPGNQVPCENRASPGLL